jgi:hypothetical protein
MSGRFFSHHAKVTSPPARQSPKWMPSNEYGARMQFMRLVALLLLSTFAAAQCDKADWIIEDDGIAGVVSREGKPLKHATVHLSSSDREYNAVTDGDRNDQTVRLSRLSRSPCHGGAGWK